MKHQWNQSHPTMQSLSLLNITLQHQDEFCIIAALCLVLLSVSEANSRTHQYNLGETNPTFSQKSNLNNMYRKPLQPDFTSSPHLSGSASPWNPAGVSLMAFQLDCTLEHLRSYTYCWFLSPSPTPESLMKGWARGHEDVCKVPGNF